jgi:hypothetical protein
VLLSKRKLINNLFLTGFAFYGIGMYRAYKGNLSEGFVLSMLPFLLILLLHGLDLMYRQRVRVVVNRVYWLSLLYLLSLVGSIWYAWLTGFPGFNQVNVIVQSLLYVVPFHAAMVVQIHNRDNDDFNFSALILKGLSLLILVNLLGYAAGLRNVVHFFEGRMNLPFLRGLYDAAHLMSIINLMLLLYFKNFLKRPVEFMGMLLFYLVNMAIMVNVNSRLSFLMFLVLTVLFALRIMRTLRLLYPISLFTMPLLMSFALLIYEILTLPIFAKLMTRVDKEDVTTFNSRTYIWEAAWEWFMHDRRGLLFGSGYNGQYGLGMMEHIAAIFQTDYAYNVHMHSTFLAIVMSQGLFGYVLFCVLMWYGYTFYRRRYLANGVEAPLFGAMVYLLFIWQIDIFVYGLDIGTPLFFSMLSYLAIDKATIVRESRDMEGRSLAAPSA